MSLERFSEMANRLVDEIPPILSAGLNGGVLVVPEAKRSEGRLILGQYVVNGVMGRYILFYYGSFRDLLGDAPSGRWERALRKVVRHELRHHVETMAGVDDLVVEERAWLERREERK